MSYNMLSVFLVCFQNSIFLHTLCLVFLFRSALFYNSYVLFTCTSYCVYKYVDSWAYCQMYKEINCINHCIRVTTNVYVLTVSTNNTQP